MLGGITAILLPCIAGGYVLANSWLLLIILPETPGSNPYFRILLLGFLWFILHLGGAIWFWDSLEEFTKAASIDFWEKPPFKQDKAFWQTLLIGSAATGTALMIRVMLYPPTFVFFFCRRVLDLQFLLQSHMPNFSKLIEEVSLEMALATLKGKGRNMEIFLSKTASHRSLIACTLSNDKVYIGWPLSSLWTSKSPEWVRLVPLASGHRDKQSREMKIINPYTDLNKDPDLEDLMDLEMILSVKDMVSLLPFDFRRHEEIQALK